MKPVKRSALTLFLAVLSFVAAAHPHSFIRLQTQVVSENEQFVALKMRWTMDALTSADLLYDAGNAAPGSEIWKKLAAEVMAKEGANKRGNSSRLTQSFHFFMFEPIFS
ncbi:DUF1007 family protein, partial [Salmonella enterica]|uniref:DUF1007 family protein n=1 Tax=Salmonella enterica TaxID=28901 RepID=UPI0020CA9C8E